MPLFTELPLRPLMRNWRRRRSRDPMLAPNLDQKAVPHDGPRLLPGLIVRARRRLVAREPILRTTEARTPRPALGERGAHPRHPRPVAPLPQRAGLLALRPGAPALL